MQGTTPADLAHLRRAIALAAASTAIGARPFGAVLVGPDGGVVAEAGSVRPAPRRDWTAHAELVVLREAGLRLDWPDLAASTLYASAEPCPMCAGAVFWCNVGRLVFGVSEPAIRALRGSHARGAGIALSCRTVLDAAPRSIAVIGPLLEEEAIAAHRRYWAGAAGHA